MLSWELEDLQHPTVDIQVVRTRCAFARSRRARMCSSLSDLYHEWEVVMSKNASRRMLTLFPFLVGFACPAAAATEARVSEAYGKLPLHFEANRGQTHRDVRFLARGAGYSLFLTPTEAVLTLIKPEPLARKRAARGSSRPRGPVTGVVLRMTLAGANPDPRVTGLEELPARPITSL